MPAQPDSSINIDKLRQQLDAIYTAVEEPALVAPQTVQPASTYYPFANRTAVNELTEKAKSHSPDYSSEKAERVATIGGYIDRLRISRLRSPATAPGFFKKSLKLLTGSDAVPAIGNKVTKRELIQAESHTGGQLFGSIPQGHHRQFFNLDPATWVWYEEWSDEKGKSHNKTTRYEVHENGIMKVQDNAPYYYIESQELDNLVLATQMYYDRVAKEVYNFDTATGRMLAA